MKYIFLSLLLCNIPYSYAASSTPRPLGFHEEEFLTALYLCSPDAQQSCTLDSFLKAKRHNPEIATRVAQNIQIIPGSTAMQVQSASISIGKHVVISCFVAGLDLTDQLMLKGIHASTNFADKLVNGMRTYWDITLMGKDASNPSATHLPTGRYFRDILIKEGYTSLNNVAALCIVSSRFGATAYFMKQHPAISIADTTIPYIASTELQWLGKDRAHLQAALEQVWILKHPIMQFVAKPESSQAILRSKEFDYAFKIDGRSIADCFATPLAKRQRRA